MARTRVVVRRAHRWLGLLLGAQLILWLSGGVVMSLLPIEMVRGTHWVQRELPENALKPELFTLAPAQLGGVDAGVLGVSTGMREGQPVYLLRGRDGSSRVVHAASGETLDELDASAAADLASRLHNEHPPALAVTRIETPDGEVRGLDGPLLRVDLDDRWNTRFYIEPLSAKVQAVRNDIWRVYDFFWMLHIMDYAERSDFNNWLLRFAAGGAWIFGLSGLWLLGFAFRR
jgi:hypothetical protein